MRRRNSRGGQVARWGEGRRQPLPPENHDSAQAGLCHEGNLAGGGQRRPPVVTRLPPTVRLETAESPAIDAFIEAIGVGGGAAAAQ